MSLFVSFEGGEGSGKSTQVDILLRRLDEIGRPALHLREPGMTPLGNAARDWLKRSRPKHGTLTDGAELFLFAAARAEMVARVLRPALDTHVVVCDRYADSTTAYQGYGRQGDLEQVAVINEVATGGVMPELTILLDCSPEHGLRRVRSSQMELPFDAARPLDGRVDPEGARRYELEPLAFHRRVREGYLRMAEMEPGRWRVVDGTRSVHEVAGEVWRHVSERLAERGAGTAKPDDLEWKARP